MTADKLDRLLAIMAALRSPDTGCPWDLEQTFESIAPYTLEEAAEVVDAIARGDRDDLKDELGDLLLQVVLHARMAEEEGSFAFGDVVEAITAKLVRRHPHVFGSTHGQSAADVKKTWDTIKAEEKAERRRQGSTQDADRVLSGIPSALPALSYAMKLQGKASTVGFDWNSVPLVLAKIREEIDEVEDAITHKDHAAVSEEVGDLLFAVVNVARHVGVDPEIALRHANIKFSKRFSYIEDQLEASGKSFSQSSLDEMEKLWVTSKSFDRT